MFNRRIVFFYTNNFHSADEDALILFKLAGHLKLGVFPHIENAVHQPRDFLLLIGRKSAHKRHHSQSFGGQQLRCRNFCKRKKNKMIFLNVANLE